MRRCSAVIRKLMPGHTLTLDAQTGLIEMRRYWDVPERGAPEAKSDQDGAKSDQDGAKSDQDGARSDQQWIGECRERLEEAVRTRLMSDVPLGMFLSGGVDSSAIAALMKRLRTEPVKTFAVGYREAAYSELSYARQVSDAIGTDHHEITIGMEDFFNALPRLVWHEDEPIAWPSSVSLYFVSRLASEHVKVVLTGEGSDELFAGYHRYQHYLFNRRWADAYRIVPDGLRREVRKLIDGSRLLSAGLRRKLRHTFLGCEGSIESLQLDNFYGAFSAAERREMLTEFRSRIRQSVCDLFVLLEFAARFRALTDALCRSEDLSGRVVDEARSDEHGKLDREPRPFPRSSVCRVCGPGSGQFENSERRGEVHHQAGCRRFTPAQHHLSKEDGFSHAAAAMVTRRAR